MYTQLFSQRRFTSEVKRKLFTRLYKSQSSLVSETHAEIEGQVKDIRQLRVSYIFL